MRLLAWFLALAPLTGAQASDLDDWLRWRLHVDADEVEDQLGVVFDEEATMQRLALGANPTSAVGTSRTCVAFRTLPPLPAVGVHLSTWGGPERGATVMGTVTLRGPRRRAVPCACATPLPAHERPPDPGPPPVPLDLERLLHDEPPIERVQRAAVEHAGCAPEVLDDLHRDARAFGALPELSLGGDLEHDQGQDLDPFENVEGSDTGRGWQLSLDLEWDLADLAMSYERIRVLAETQRRTELRARVLESVTGRYYERLAVKAQLEFDPPTDPVERVRLELEFERLTAELDGWTGGAFSRMR